jgi:hypothetical protein
MTKIGQRRQVRCNKFVHYKLPFGIVTNRKSSTSLTHIAPLRGLGVQTTTAACFVNATRNTIPKLYISMPQMEVVTLYNAVGKLHTSLYRYQTGIQAAPWTSASSLSCLALGCIKNACFRGALYISRNMRSYGNACRQRHANATIPGTLPFRMRTRNLATTTAHIPRRLTKKR